MTVRTSGSVRRARARLNGLIAEVRNLFRRLLCSWRKPQAEVPAELYKDLEMQRERFVARPSEELWRKILDGRLPPL